MQAWNDSDSEPEYHHIYVMAEIPYFITTSDLPSALPYIEEYW